MKDEAKRNVYVGHRYVPKIFGEWDKSKSYEGLSIVTHKGASYTSKKRVPVGVDILDTDYWTVTGNYNAQIEEYRKDVRDMQGHVEKEILDINQKIDTDIAGINQKIDNDISELNDDVDTKITNLNQEVDTKINALNDDVNSTKELAEKKTEIKVSKNEPEGLVIGDFWYEVK